LTKEKNQINKWLVFGLVATGIFMSTLDGSIVNIALPGIMKSFGVPITVIEWVVVVYLLVVSSLLLSFGRLSDIHGRRIIYSSGLLIFSLGSFFCGSAESASSLIMSRAFQGLGAALIMACTPAIIVDTFPLEERGRTLGMIGAVVASGLTAGPAIGAVIIQHFSWRMIFYVNIPIGLAAACAVFIILKGSNTDIKRPDTFDFKGSLYFTVILVSLLLMITKFHIWGIASPLMLTLTILFMSSLILFIVTEKRSLSPVMNLTLFENRLFYLPVLSASLLYICLFIKLFLMPFYLLTLRGFSNTKASLFLILPFLFMFIVSPLSGALADKRGSRILCTLGMIILTLSLYLTSELTEDSTIRFIAFCMSLTGIGTAMFTSPNSMIIMNSVPPQERGVAGAIIATARNIGMVVGIALSGTLFNFFFSQYTGGKTLDLFTHDLSGHFVHTFRNVLAAGSAIALTGALFAFLRGNEKKAMKKVV